jgi:lysophospholipase L1-like esterase
VNGGCESRGIRQFEIHFLLKKRAAVMRALLCKCFVAVFGLFLTVNFAVCAARDMESFPQDGSSLEKLATADSPLPSDTRLAFFGDSITMQGGFIDRIQKAIEKRAAATNHEPNKLFRHGLNGGRVPTVLAGESPWGKLGGSMSELVANEQPSLLVIFLGVNDVWHGDKGTNPEAFEDGLKAMLEIAKKTNAKVVLCTPSIIGEELKQNQLNQKLGEYADIIRRLSREQNATLCDLHAAFLAELGRVNQKNEHQGNLTYDGVHMNDAGNQLIAEQVAEAICRACAGK